MIVVDTSALLAIACNEATAPACVDVLAAHRQETALSAVTLAEALIVASSRNVGDVLLRILEEVQPEVVPVTAGTAVGAAEAYRLWGKGRHPARLNFCDCFAYALARDLDAPLLFVGDDFGRTDVATALP